MMLDVQYSMHPPFAAPSLNNLITLPSPIPSSSLPPPNPIPPPLSHLHVGLGDSVAHLKNKVDHLVGNFRLGFRV